jgi:hypothetical protein
LHVTDNYKSISVIHYIAEAYANNCKISHESPMAAARNGIPIAIKPVFRTRTDQLIVVEPKDPQLGELPNLGRDGACQRIHQSQKTMAMITSVRFNGARVYSFADAPTQAACPNGFLSSGVRPPN